MSTVMVRRMLGTIRTHNWVRIAVIALVVFAAVAISAILEGDLPEFVSAGTRGLRGFFRHYSYLPGFGLLYIEESGIPLPAPGDVFVLYVGAHVPRNLFSYLAAWLGLIAAVVLGATNLFFISKRYGRRLAEGSFGAYVHLSPARLARAESWFKRYGVLAIIFGRHIPGFRVPITVAAGVFRVRYPLFAVSVAISTAIWAGVVIVIGINFGNRLAEFLRLHSYMYAVWAAIVVAIVAGHFINQRLERARAHAVGGPAAR
jgi:membrane protein DedA with SNARE-associated domain